MDIVKRKIEQLDTIFKRKGRITFRHAAELIGVSVTKIQCAGKDKNSLVSLVEQMMPVYEKWPTVEDVMQRLGVSISTVYQWYKKECARNAMGAVKVQERIRFSPEWFNALNSIREYIDTNEVAKILGIAPLTACHWRHHLQAVQPFGKKGELRYDKSKAIELKKKIDKTKGLLRPSEAATNLGMDVQVLKRNVPFKVRHPITNERYYDSKTLDEFRDSPATELSSLRQVLDFCDKHYPTEGLRDVVKNFVEGGRLKTVRDKRMKSLFLEHEEEMRVRKIYENTSKLGFVNLLWPREAVKKIGISLDNLTLLMRHGKQILLDEKANGIETDVGYKITGKRMLLVPVMPYFKFFPDGIGYVHSSTAEEMQTYTRGVNTTKNDWASRVAERIREKRKAQTINP